MANRTAATPWLLQEIEQRAKAGSCEFALLVPPTERRHPDWTLDVALSHVEQAAGARVHVLESGPDWFAAVRRELSERNYDEVLVSTRPVRGPKLLRRDLVSRIESLGVPVTTMVPGERVALDHGVLKVRWDDGGP